MVAKALTANEQMKNSGAVFRIMNSPVAHGRGRPRIQSDRLFREELQEGRARPRRELEPGSANGNLDELQNRIKQVS